MPRDCDSEASQEDYWEEQEGTHTTPAFSEWQDEKHQAHSPVCPATPTRSEGGTLENNLGMHDSTSSLRKGADKPGMEFSVNTMPVEQ